MKIAIVHAIRRRIRRVVDVAPKNLPAGVEAAEITDEQAEAVAAARAKGRGMFLVGGDLKTLEEHRPALEESSAAERRAAIIDMLNSNDPNLRRIDAVVLVLAELPIPLRSEFADALLPGLVLGDSPLALVRLNALNENGRSQKWMAARNILRKVFR
jgi:predicted DCC family thiol-disulfide oxidoreductase YuxK